MKETIGAKGGSNDRRKTAIITRSKKKKLSEDLGEKRIKELEKKVRKIQVINFLTAVPLVISASVFKTFLKNCNTINKGENKKTKSFELPSLEREEINKDIDEKIDNDKEEKDSIKKDDNIDKLPIVIVPIDEIVKTNKEKVEKKEVEEDKEEIKPKEEVINKDIDKKIIETYGEELKKVRTELKEIAYSNSKSGEYEDYSNEAKLLLDKLNLVIKKLDDCSDMIETSKLGDENYYYELALKYIDEFNNRSVVDGIKDSDLYIEISDKLKVIDKKKEELRKKVFDKQMDMAISNGEKNEKEESTYDEFEYDDIKKCIEDIEEYQEEIIKEMDNIPKKTSKPEEKEEKKVNKDSFKFREILQKESNAISEVDIALSKAKALNKYCNVLLATINKASMKRPSVRSTKAVATTTLIATYFMRKLLKGRFVRKRKKIKKVDYSKYMENNLADINNAIELIREASNKLDDLINDIRARFSEYLYLKEFQELLGNLEEIKGNIREKEYEINNIKNNYVNGLNNQKVK